MKKTNTEKENKYLYFFLMISLGLSIISILFSLRNFVTIQIWSPAYYLIIVLTFVFLIAFVLYTLLCVHAILYFLRNRFSMYSLVIPLVHVFGTLISILYLYLGTAQNISWTIMSVPFLTFLSFCSSIFTLLFAIFLLKKFCLL